MDELTQLLIDARSGDAEAAAAFVRGTQAEVWRLCAHLGARESADDLTQETYARAFASLRRFAGRSSARTWLLSIARRVCADSIRSAVRSRRHIADYPVLAGDGDGFDDQSPADHEQARRAGHVPDIGDGIALQGMLDALPSERREAFVLTQLLGLSYAEAAEIGDCPIGTIRSRVARAREDLVRGWHGERAERRSAES
jgi:RNA polymerase sigma-70 factor (ECF subfamily)